MPALVVPNECEEVHPHQLLERLISPENRGDVTRLVSLYATVRQEFQRASDEAGKPQTHVVSQLGLMLGLDVPHPLIGLLRSMELLSIVTTAMMWWIGGCDDERTNKLLIETVIDALRFKRQVLASEEGRRISKFAQETFGIISF
jgi:hypothetical protein